MDCPFCGIEMHSTASAYCCSHCRVRFVLVPVGILTDTRADYGTVYRFGMRLAAPRFLRLCEVPTLEV